MERAYLQPRLAMLLILLLCCGMVSAGCEYNTIVEEPLLTPLKEVPAPLYVELEASLESIQDSLFSGTCQNSRCHDCCWNAAELDLSRGKSYENLVNVPSMQDPSVMRVAPGKPDSSYLIWKLEGHPDMQGVLMPIEVTPRRVDDRVIQVIRDWITAGAQGGPIE